MRLSLPSPLIWLSLCLLMMVPPAVKASALLVDANAKQQLLTPEFHVFKHQPGLNAQNILRIPITQWQPTDQNTLNMGSTRQVYWFSTEIVNPTNQELERFIEIERQIVDIIDVYLIQGQIIQQTYQLGDSRPLSNRPVLSNKFIVPVQLAPQSRYRLLLYVDSQGGSMQISSSLWQPLSFFAQKQREDFLDIILYGGSLALALYNLFIFFSIRQRAYAYYTAYALMFVYGFASLSGYTQLFLWQDSTLFHQISNAISFHSCRVFAYLFTIHFLRSYQHLPKCTRLIYIIIVIESITSVLLIGALIQQNSWLYSYVYALSSNVLFSLPIPICFTLGCYLLLKNVREARFFCSAWFVLCISYLLYSLSIVSNILPYNDSIEYIFKASQLLEMILLSFALADRLNLARQNKLEYEAQELANKQDIDTVKYQLSEKNVAIKQLREKQKVEASELSNQAKHSFLAQISHEIRTPMNTIMGHSQLIEDDPNLPTILKNNVEAINSSGERLMGLVNNALEADNVETGQVTITPTSINVEGLINKTINYYRPLCEKKNLYLHNTYIKSLPKLLLVDEDKLQKILNNLLSNALKFTQSGGISVTISNDKIGLSDAKHSENAIFLHIEVADTGCGIAKQDYDKVFQRFELTQSGIEHGHGVGLGLSIHRQYAQLMDGDINFTSQQGRGSVFLMNILCEPSDGTSHQTEMIPVSDSIPNKSIDTKTDWHSTADLLPRPHKEGLCNAIMRGDVVEIDQRLQQLPPAYTALAEHLSSLAKRYDYETMLDLLE